MKVYILHEACDTGFGPQANRIRGVFYTEEQALEAMQTFVDEYLNHLCTETERVQVGDWVYLRAVDGPHAGEDLLHRTKLGVEFHRLFTIWLEMNGDDCPEDEYSTDVRGYSIEEVEMHTLPARHKRSVVR